MAEENAAVVAAETLGRDMLEGILETVRQFPGWESLTQHQQDVHIQRISQRVQLLVSQALDIIFKGEYPACIAELGAVTFGKAIKAKIEIAKTAQSRHELADATGQRVVVVMCDPEQYFERMKDIRGAADQRDLFHDPAQPLGHMGTDRPVAKDEPPAENTGGLDDALPPEPPPEELNIPKQIDEGELRAKLSALGIRIPLELTEEQRVDAYVWALAAEKAKAENRTAPFLPSFLEHDEAAGTSNEGPKGEVAGLDIASGTDQAVVSSPGSAVTWDGTPEQLVELLAARRVIVTRRMVKQWNQTQKMAAFAWVAGKAKERPDFLPQPKVPNGPETQPGESP